MRIQQKSKTYSKTKRTKKGNPFRFTWNGVPATVRQTLFERTLPESILKSFVWHIVAVLIIWALTFCFIFFNLGPKLFPQQPKIKDIEFNIKGGRHHRTRHIARATAQSISPEPKTVNQQPKTNVTPVTNNQSKTINKPTTQKQTVSKKAVSDFSVPMPDLKSLSSGLGGSSSKTRHTSSGGSSSGTSLSDINNAFSSDGGSSSASSGFDKGATKKIITTYDISPYVNELKRNIRLSWKPAKGYENKRVELFLRIARDGKLIILNVKRTSEVGEVDNAALNAVKKCQPLHPLPSKYAKNYLDVVFTFGSNSVGSRY